MVEVTGFRTRISVPLLFMAHVQKHAIITLKGQEALDQRQDDLTLSLVRKSFYFYEKKKVV